MTTLSPKETYQQLKALYDSLLRKGDFREILQLRRYLTTQGKICEMIDQHMPTSTIQSIQQQIPSIGEIMHIYSNRENVPNILEVIQQRLDKCDNTYTSVVLPLIPDDPVLFVEMNDLETYLQRVVYLDFCTDVVELASVHENIAFVQHWMKMMMACKKTVDACAKWMRGVEEDIRQEVFCNQKTWEWIQHLQWCIRVAQRVDDSMKIIGSEMDGCFEELEKTYTELVELFNAEQKDLSRCVKYERMQFDFRDKCRCQLCLHASKMDRPMAHLLGRRYHPECANLWISQVEKMIPVFVEKEHSLY